MAKKTRSLSKSTLDGAVRDYAGHFLQPTRLGTTGMAIAGADWVLQSMFNFHFKDEFEYVLNGLKGFLGQDAWSEFDTKSKEVFTPRSNDVFEQELEERLAMRPNGDLVKGKLGKVIIGERIVGYRNKVKTLRGREHHFMKPIKEPVYMGDTEFMGSMGAFVPNFSAECIILALDAIVDNLDEGAGAAVIQGRTGAQPADPDATTTGTNLFTLAMSATAFGAASDQADGTVDATAASITDDSSADATGTLGYCRVSSTADGATPADDHIDGEAGTSGADFNFNAWSIVSGATVSLTSYVVSMSQGSTAS